MSLVGRWRYYARDAVDEWRHSPGVNLLATATLAAVLFAAGLFLLVLDNASARLGAFRDDLRVEIYLHDDVDAARLDRLRSAIGNTVGVARVEYVSKDEALDKFRAWFPELADVPRELGVNPFPASLEVFLDRGHDAAAVARTIRDDWADATGVDQIRFDIEWIDRVDSLLTLARAASIVLGLATFAVVVFVIASVLRLAVYARRDEIEIMALVGATPGFVRGPFLFAGFVQGLVASAVAVAAVDVLRRVLVGYATSEGVALVAVLAGRPLALAASVQLVAVGVAVSLVGAWLAVRPDVGTRPLR